MSNLVQYFADIGGFDSVIALISMGLKNEKEKDVKLPICMIHYLIQPFRQLRATLT